VLRWLPLLGALLVAVSAAVPAVASADPQVVTFACTPSDNNTPCKVNPDVQVSFSDDPNLQNASFAQITVTNPMSNSDMGNLIITEIDGTVPHEFNGLDSFQANGPPTADDGTTEPSGPNGFCGNNTSDLEYDSNAANHVFDCQLANPQGTTNDGAIKEGESQTFEYTCHCAMSRDDRANGGLFSTIYVWFNYANLPAGCRPDFNNALARAAAQAVTADDCVTPTKTRITHFKINQRKRIASFTMKAHGTKKFICELDRNGKRLFRHSCSSKKEYAHPLKRGRYLFWAWGVNHVGIDSNPALHAFKIK
jgi:hypothetical protein